MRSIITSSLLLMATVSAWAGGPTINPFNQINWTKVAGAGAPSATCSASIYGMPYTNTTNGDFYVCASTGWVLVGSGSGGSGTVSGQAAGVVGLATNSTTTGAQSHINENTPGQTTITQKVVVSDGSGNAGAYQPAVGTDAGGTAGTATYTTDTTNGYAEVHEGTAALSRVCTAANGVCAGTPLTLRTDGVLNGSQALLNLVAGTNTTLTDNGSGSVTIDSTGGGSGGGQPASCTVSVGNQLCLTDTTYNASPNGQTTTTTSGTTGVGTSVTLAASGCTNAHFDSTSAGSRYGHEGVYIAGAGAAGVPYIGTVTSCSGTAMVVTPATSTSIATGALVQHDETAAFAAAMTYFASNGSGNIWLNDGWYMVNGALQDTSGANAVIKLPNVLFSNPALSIGIYGFTRPSGDNGTAQTTGAIIQSAIPSGNLIGGYCAGCGDNTFTNVGLNVQSIRFMPNANPNFTIIDASETANANIFATAFAPIGSTCGSMPTNTGGWAVKMPSGENGVWNTIDSVGTSCIYHGYLFGPHTRVGSAYTSWNVNAFTFDTQNGDFNSISAAYLWAQHSTCGIVGGSNNTNINVQVFDSESNIGTNSLCDSGNKLYGVVNYNPVGSPSSPFTLTPLGGIHLTLNNLPNTYGQTNGSARSVVGITGAATAAHMAVFATNGIDVVDGGVPGTGTTTNALTTAISGGAAAGTTFDGSVARTFDYHSFGALAAASGVFTGTPDASGATQFKLPVAAGFATLANGEAGYDTTNKNWHAWINGADTLLVPLASGFTSGHCAQPTTSGGSWSLVDAGGACGVSGGGSAFSAITSGTNTTAAMLVGSGSSLDVTGTGTINATKIGGVTVTGTPSTGNVPTATSSSTATWQAPPAGFFGLYTFVAPPTASWTSDLPLAGSTFDTTYGYPYLHGVAGAPSTDNINNATRTAPATPYVISAAVQCDLSGITNAPANTNTGQAGCGLVFSDGTKFTAFGIDLPFNIPAGTPTGPPYLRVTQWTNHQLASGVAFQVTANNWQAFAGSMLRFLQIADDGTNLKYSVSIDGNHWYQVFSQSRTAFYTSGPTKVGMYMICSASSEDTGCGDNALVSWYQH